MRRRNWLLCGVAFACFWLGVTGVRADQIYLQNGSILTGKIVGEQGKYSVVHLASGRLTIETAEIVHIAEGPSIEELLRGIPLPPPPEPEVTEVPPEQEKEEEPTAKAKPPIEVEVAPELKAKADGFLKVISDKNLEWKEQEEAAKKLTQLGKPVVAYLCSRVKGLPWEQGVIIVGVLGEIRDQEAVSTLIQLMDDSHPEVQAMAAMVLGYFDDEAAVPALIKALVKGEEVVRKKAVVSLARFPKPEVAEALAQALDDESWWVRIKAQQGLAQLGSQGEKVDPIATLIKALEGTNTSQRAAACKALAQLGDKRAVEPLLGVLDDDDERVRVAAALALGSFPGERVVDTLLEKYYWARPVFRAALARSLGQLGDPVVIPTLIEALLDEDEAVALASGKALSTLTRRNFGTAYERWREWWQMEASPSLRAQAQRPQYY